MEKKVEVFTTLRPLTIAATLRDSSKLRRSAYQLSSGLSSGWVVRRKVSLPSWRPAMCNEAVVLPDAIHVAAHHCLGLVDREWNRAL